MQGLQLWNSDGMSSVHTFVLSRRHFDTAGLADLARLRKLDVALLRISGSVTRAEPPCWKPPPQWPVRLCVREVQTYMCAAWVPTAMLIVDGSCTTEQNVVTSHGLSVQF